MYIPTKSNQNTHLSVFSHSLRWLWAKSDPHSFSGFSQRWFSFINRMHVFYAWNTSSRSFTPWAHNTKAAHGQISIVMAWVSMELTQTTCIRVRDSTMHIIHSCWLVALQVNLTLRFQLMWTWFPKIAALNAVDRHDIEMFNLHQDLLSVHHFVVQTCRHINAPYYVRRFDTPPSLGRFENYTTTPVIAKNIAMARRNRYFSALKTSV